MQSFKPIKEHSRHHIDDIGVTGSSMSLPEDLFNHVNNTYIINLIPNMLHNVSDISHYSSMSTTSM